MFRTNVELVNQLVTQFEERERLATNDLHRHLLLKAISNTQQAWDTLVNLVNEMLAYQELTIEESAELDTFVEIRMRNLQSKLDRAKSITANEAESLANEIRGELIGIDLFAASQRCHDTFHKKDMQKYSKQVNDLIEMLGIEATRVFDSAVRKSATDYGLGLVFLPWSFVRKLFDIDNAECIQTKLVDEYLNALQEYCAAVSAWSDNANRSISMLGKKSNM